NQILIAAGLRRFLTAASSARHVPAVPGNQVPLKRRNTHMFIEGILPAARNRLSIVSDDATLMDAAGRLADAQINLVTVIDSGGKLVGVITKTDVVRQISGCRGSSCTI